MYLEFPVKPGKYCLAYVYFQLINNLYILDLMAFLTIKMTTPLIYTLF